ncbi:hypothetical protein BUALT_Bualt13G0080100 [Buddleja alternifolia]|uniref:Glycosyltransferase n=1 Tax=Buddleja alternifolia TaxID=168488 RepID=A0AAV6WWI6_9LAMI|nr:hypothetical protein BUALT_Bualt13G0080100 [Buddleja alternifolia]
MTKTSSTLDALIDFVSFDDGYDNGWSNADYQDFMLAQRKHGGKAVEDVVAAARDEGQPITRVIYSLLVPWAAQVAYNLQLPVTLLWIEPATLFGVYYYYFNKYFDGSLGSNQAIELPGLPSLEGSDLPSFMLTSSPNIYDFALPTLFENFQILDREAKRPTVLVNTFQELEVEPLRAIDKYKLMAIGPLIPSAFLDGKDPSDTSFGGDLIEKSVDDYVEWLDFQEKLSVIYVAFGSYSEISKPQMEEIAKGLIESQRPFLWVIRGAEKEEMVSCRVDLEKQGKIVSWCSQVEVLSHSSVGCFVTHCGWNSSLESIVLGVPTVLFPQWCDQATNAKLIQDYWKTGLRVVKPENGGVIEGDEIKRCLDIVMDGGQMRMEAKKWRELAKEAMNEDGSSNVNLNIFLHDQLDEEIDARDARDTSFGGDLIEKSVEDYVEWLDSQGKLSVIYVAFGSFSEISKPQMEEVAKGLIKSQRPFLWVIRGAEKEEMVSCRVDLEKQGKIVGDEIKRSFDIVMDGGEMRKEAQKWRELAKEAMKEDGSSNVNLNIFLHQLGEE